MYALEDEVLHFKKFANLSIGSDGVVGIVMITNKRIIFNTNFFNLQSRRTEILINDIKKAKKVNSLGFVPNAISLTTNSGDEFKFAVLGREKIISFLAKISKEYR